MFPGIPRRLFRSIFSTQQEEITCPMCLDLLDIYVDAEITGADAVALMPHVRWHLDCCHRCRELYVGLRELADQL